MNIPDVFLVNDYKSKTSVFTPVSVINYLEFKRLLMNDSKLLSEDLELYHKELSKTLRYKWGNTHFRFSNIYGDEFAFQIYGQEITVWNYSGVTTICHATLDDDLEKRNQTINDIVVTSEKWSNGEVKCSDCHRWMSFSENSNHHYFAGVYCLDCWERKWKAIEAKESYE